MEASPTRSRHPVIHAALLVLLCLSIPADAQPCPGTWLPSAPIPGVLGDVTALTTWDPDGPGPRTPVVVIGGRFDAAGDIPANNIAAWDPATRKWSALSSGVSGRVRALITTPNGDLIAGGDFTTVGQTPASRIARWNGAAWSAFGSGLTSGGNSASVFDLAVLPDGRLAVGGSFTTAGGIPASNIAVWNGTHWSPLGAGTDNSVSALTVTPQGDLYAGGVFATAGGTLSKAIARWNGTSWSAVGPGIATSGGNPPQVFTLATLSNGDVIAAGYFSLAGDSPATNIARWNGTSWSSLGSGLGSTSPNTSVFAVRVLPNDQIIAGGAFSSPNVMRWDGSLWSPIGPSVYGGVQALCALPNGDIVAGGTVYHFGDAWGNGIAHWNGAAWLPLATGMYGTTTSCVASLPDGRFLASGGLISDNPQAASITLWNGQTWESAGAVPAGFANTIISSPTGDILAAGQFITTLAGFTVNGILRWNGAAWSFLGRGLEQQSTINALAVLPNGDIIAGGSINSAANLLVHGLARWNGSTWTPLWQHTYDGGTINAMAVMPSGDLIVAGLFSINNGATQIGLARWNGASWSEFGPHLNGEVFSIAFRPDGSMFAAGTFTTAGAFPAQRIALLTHGTWTPLGSGISGSSTAAVRTLTIMPNGNLVAAGNFTTAGGAPVTNLALWDGSTWLSLANQFGGDAGTTFRSSCLLPSGTLAIAGSSASAISAAAARLAFWKPPCSPNCDCSTSQPILTANDFQCFLNKFAAVDPYANCDHSTNPPTLNVNDFQCFLNQYAAGCP